MSRRSRKWIATVIQAGGRENIGRVMPNNNVDGKGLWHRGDNPPGATAGGKVTTAISERKAELFRDWATRIGKKS